MAAARRSRSPPAREPPPAPAGSRCCATARRSSGGPEGPARAARNRLFRPRTCPGPAPVGASLAIAKRPQPPHLTLRPDGSRIMDSQGEDQMRYCGLLPDIGTRPETREGQPECRMAAHRARLLGLLLLLAAVWCWPMGAASAQSWQTDRGYAEGPITFGGPLQAEPLFECMGGKQRFHLFVRWRGEVPSVVSGQMYVRWDEEGAEQRLTHGSEYSFTDPALIARLRRHSKATFRLVGAEENLTRRRAPEATFVVSLRGSRAAIDGALRNCR